MPEVSDVVLRTWQRALEVESPGLDDDFFADGGTSLLAARLIAELNDELGLAVGLRTLADNSTVRSLTAALGAELARRSQPSGQSNRHDLGPGEC